MLEINAVLQQNRYRIVQQIGQNEIIATYEAYDNVLKESVVIKELIGNFKKVATIAQQESNKSSFVNEAKKLTEIKHDSFLNIYNYFVEIDRQYLVMELVNGNDLGELLKRSQKPFGLTDVLRWADQLLDAINYLHTRTPAIIHRDIKPQNLKLTSDGKLKLLTFDITKNSSYKVVNSVSSLSFDESVLNYLPLENIWGGLDSASRKVILNSYDEKSEKILEQPADVRSDIYALGATIYHLATGKMPIDPLERSIDTLEGKPDPLPTLNQLNPSIPREISDVIMKSLEIRRENRFDSAGIMRHMLRAAFGKVKQIEAEKTKQREQMEAEKAKQREAEIKLAQDQKLLEERKLIEEKRLAVEAEQKRLEQERLIIEKQRLEIEAEQKRQAELIQKQLREAEEQRIKAEEILAKAEIEKNSGQNILENPLETKKVDEDFEKIDEFIISKPLAETPQTSTDLIDDTNSNQSQSNSDEFNNLFAVPQKENKTMGRMALVIAIFAVIGGAAWGGWKVMSAKENSPVQTVATQEISSEEKPLATPKVETATPTPEPTVETARKTVETPTDTKIAENNSSQTAFKNKSVAATTPQIQPKKPVISAVKPPANQKKPVTVDDLINNN